MTKAGSVLLHCAAAVMLCVGIATARGEDMTAAPAADPRLGDGGVSAFYAWQGALPSKPGRLLRQEPLPASRLPPHAASGTRLLYSSLSGVGQQGPVAVSGVLLLPQGAPPAGGWPVVAWAHGTTGFADVCAPSWRGTPARDTAYLDGWLARGFAIVATDYEGLGTPGDHPYLLYRSEAHSVLDSVRAALSDPDARLRNRIVLVGQSQGAGAALGAAWLHPRYAPELDIKAAVLTGLVTGIATARTHDKAKLYSDPDRMDPSFAMLRFAGTDHALHLSADLPGFLTPKGRQMLDTALHGCLHDLFNQAHTLGLKTGGEMFAHPITPIDQDMEANFTLPDGKIALPVFVGTGLADGEAGAGGQYDAVAAMCAAGSPVVWHTYPGLTHNGTVNGSIGDSSAFAAAVLAGHPPISNCASISAPGALETPMPGVPFND